MSSLNNDFVATGDSTCILGDHDSWLNWCRDNRFIQNAPNQSELRKVLEVQGTMSNARRGGYRRHGHGSTALASDVAGLPVA